MLRSDTTQYAADHPQQRGRGERLRKKWRSARQETLVHHRRVVRVTGHIHYRDPWSDRLDGFRDAWSTQSGQYDISEEEVQWPTVRIGQDHRLLAAP